MSLSYDLEQLIKNNPFPEFIHFVMPGAVVSGQFVTSTPETITLQNATTYTGGSAVEIESVELPIEKIIGWGEGEINRV
jgi:hypothetical protein